MKAFTLRETQRIEEYAIRTLGIPRIALMESAGAHVAKIILQTVGFRGPVLVLAGKGYNGGDALVAAKYLRNQGVPVEVLVFSKEDALKDETRLLYSVLKKLGVSIKPIVTAKDIKTVSQRLKKAAVVIDGILGIGLSHPVEGWLRDAIRTVNKERKDRPVTFPLAVFAIDIPSGLETDTGKARPEALMADITVTFHAPKIGHLTGTGALATGKLYVADIGIPHRDITGRPLIEPVQWSSTITEMITAQDISSLLGMRHTQSHKGSYGHALIIAGSRLMPGAAILTCKAALRSGAGLVTLAAPQSVSAIVAPALPEVIHLPLPENEAGTISPEALSQINFKTRQYSAAACGPGLSQSSGTAAFVSALLSQKWNIPLILDADALNILAVRKPRILWKGPLILTPHPGEMSRLLGKSVDKIQTGRVEYAQRAAKKFKALVVLKGAATVIASPQGPILINSTGNPGMATAGTGDVLTGILAGLIAQKFDPLSAAAAGVFTHGLAGDTVAALKSPEGLMASDIIETIPYAFSVIRQGGGVFDV